jgi:hypothetical protein
MRLPVLLKLLKTRSNGNTIRMYLTKQFINSAVKLAGRFIPEQNPKNTNSLMLSGIQQHLSKLADVEFAEITRREGKPQDRNFQNFISIAFKTAVYLSESDPYYELWLGELLKTIQEKRTTAYKQYAKQIQRSIREAKKTCDEVLVEASPEFTKRCWNLKTCGGLQLLEEELTQEQTETEEEQVCLTASPVT